MDTISYVIENGYQTINKFSENYYLNEGNIDNQQHWSNQFQKEFIRHSTSEEIVLLPEYEKHNIIHESHHDHQKMKNLLFLLETIAITDPQYRVTFDKLVKKFHKHTRRELDVNLPKLEKLLTSDKSLSLANLFEQTKNSSQLRVYPTSAINPPL